ncbi:MAG: hypothetical protein C4293_01850, partial [Nitrospiraceae bacterium]
MGSEPIVLQSQLNQTKGEGTVLNSVKTGLILSVLCGLAGVAAALDVADVTPEWTPEGKKIAMERA